MKTTRRELMYIIRKECCYHLPADVVSRMAQAILDREVEKSERSLEFSPIPGPSKVREFEPSNRLF